ncbi:MAG TPA: hypothetical protein VFW23_10850 [Tepidisphaeraceae bacterium]|nr:hypothetical protein [Tepidisphaeraceae bacterium]
MANRGESLGIIRDDRRTDNFSFNSPDRGAAAAGNGIKSHPVWPAFANIVQRFRLPIRVLKKVARESERVLRERFSLSLSLSLFSKLLIGWRATRVKC